METPINNQNGSAANSTDTATNLTYTCRICGKIEHDDTGLAHIFADTCSDCEKAAAKQKADEQFYGLLAGIVARIKSYNNKTYSGITEPERAWMLAQDIKASAVRLDELTK